MNFINGQIISLLQDNYFKDIPNDREISFRKRYYSKLSSSDTKNILREVLSFRIIQIADISEITPKINQKIPDVWKNRSSNIIPIEINPYPITINP